jgi:thiol:disulfide interchange protein
MFCFSWQRWDSLGLSAAKEKNSVFSRREVIFIPMAVMESADPREAPLKLKVSYQACDDRRCLLPTSLEQEVNVQIVPQSAEVKPLHKEVFRDLKDRQDRVSVSLFGWDFAFGGSKLWLLLFIAAVEGLLLNFTPCVLPLIPIKIMGLSRVAQIRSRCLVLGSVMSLGVVAFWMALGIAITSISGFNAANKLFHVSGFHYYGGDCDRRHGGRDVRALCREPSRLGLPREGFAGNGPRLHSLRDYGGGAFHALHGPVHGRSCRMGSHATPGHHYWWLVAFFVAAAGGWLAWQTIHITSKVARRVVFAGLGILLMVIAATIGVRFTRSSAIHWIYYTPERLAEAQAHNRIVVLEFTAAWCLNCHALEQAVLHDSRVVDALNSSAVAPIKVDITGNNPAGDRKLAEVGRRTIPYLLIYSGSGRETFSSDAYSVKQLVTAIREAQNVP